MKVKNILIVGFGSIAKKHLENFIKNRFNGKIFVLSQRKHINIDNKILFHKNIDEIKNEDINLIVICSQSNLHLSHLRLCSAYFGNKAYYLIEKPICNNFQKCNLFFKKNNINKKKLFVGYQIQYSQGLKKIRDLVKKNNKKKIISVNIECQSYLPNWRNNRNFKYGASLDKNGGGVLLELSHEINYLISLFGLPQKLICSSPKNKCFLSNVDENIVAQFFYKDGKIVNLKINFDNQFYSSRCCEIRYIDKLLIWNLNTKELKVNYKKKIKKYKFLKDKDLLKQQYINIMSMINNNKNNYSLDESLITLKIIDLMKKSIKKKGLVIVE